MSGAIVMCAMCGKRGVAAKPTCEKCLSTASGNVLVGKPTATDLKYLEWLKGRATDGSSLQH